MAACVLHGPPMRSQGAPYQIHLMINVMANMRWDLWDQGDSMVDSEIEVTVDLKVKRPCLARLLLQRIAMFAQDIHGRIGQVRDAAAGRESAVPWRGGGGHDPNSSSWGG